MISVCLATHNGEKYISQQLTSILKQIDSCDEVIVSDDNSTDSTLAIIRSVNDRRVKVLGPNYFNSPVKNFEYALLHSRGDIIFLSDQDDIWHDNKVELMMEQINQGFDLIVSDCSIVNNNMHIIVPSYFKLNNSGAGFSKNLLKNGFMGCCMAFNRKVLSRALPFPQRLPMHDVWIGLIAEALFKVKFLDQPTLYYRQHDNNASATAEGLSKYSFRNKLMFRVTLVKYLFKRLILVNGKRFRLHSHIQ